MVARVLLAGLVALGLGLRLWGVGFGLPETYHPDEPAYVLQALAVGRGLSGGLTFANPPLFKYLLLGEYGATYGLGRLVGRYTTPQDLVAQFRADPTLLYLEARVTSALAGALTVLATYTLAEGRRAGLVAAWLAAVTFLLVRDAHFGVNDAFVTLLSTMALSCCARLAGGGSRRDQLLAGVLSGLAFTAKYQALALLVPLLLAHARRPRALPLTLGAMLLAIAVTFPSLWLEPGRVLGDIYLHLVLPGQVGYAGLEPVGGYVYYLDVLGWGVGWAIVVAALTSLALVRRAPGLLVIASFPAVLYAVLGAERLYFARLILPGLPALLALAAIAVDRAAAGLRTRRTLVVVGLAALLGSQSVLAAVRLDVLLSRPDTRTEARDWVALNLPSGARLAVDAAPLGPPLPADQLEVVVANGWSLYERAPSAYRADGVAYIVTSSFTLDPPESDPSREAQRRAFVADLAATADELIRFGPSTGHFTYDEIYAPAVDLWQREQPGPTIVVFRLR